MAVALGAGYFMQSGGKTTPFANTSPPTSIQESNASGALELDEITLTSALPSATLQPSPLAHPPAVETPAALDTSILDDVPGEEPAPAFTCDYTLTADAAPGAMALLSLDVPCMPNERFTMHHNGLMFSQVTDEGGHASMLVPALATEAVFIAAFPNGEGAVANTTIDALEFYERVAVQWQGDLDMHLHALEFGADYGSEGHVWSEAPRDVSDAATGERG